MHVLFVLCILNILGQPRNKVKVLSVKLLSSQALDIITGILTVFHVPYVSTANFFTSVEVIGYIF
jgi:hypothetical protein